MTAFTQLAIVDVETIDKDHHEAFGGNNRVISIGLAILSLADLSDLEQRYTMLDIGDAIKRAAPEAMTVNKLRPAQLTAEGFAPMIAMSRMFADINWEQTCFASWGDYDLEMVEGEYKLLGGWPPPFRRKFFDIRSACGLATMKRRGSEAWEYMSCQEYAGKFDTRMYNQAAERMTMEELEPHHALYDVLTNVANLRHALSLSLENLPVETV